MCLVFDTASSKSCDDYAVKGFNMAKIGIFAFIVIVCSYG
jgi:hypothetical protein